MNYSRSIMTARTVVLSLAASCALVAGLLPGIPLTSATANSGGTIGGSTGGVTEDVGSGTIGSGGVSGGGMPDFGNLGNVGSIGNVPWYDYYSAETKGCAEGAVGTKTRFTRKVVSGKYVDTPGKRECIFPAKYVIEAYKSLCVDTARIKIEQIAPTRRVLFDSAAKTTWGKGERTVAACQASAKLEFTKTAHAQRIGQYKSTGSTSLDILYVKHYLSADRSGRVPPDSFHSKRFAKRVNGFERFGTLSCSGWKDELAPFNTSCSPELPTTPPKHGSPVPSDAAMRCTVPGVKPSIDGVSTSTVDLLRDGGSHALSWGQPSITGKGISNVRPKSTQFLIWGAPEAEGSATENAFDLRSGGVNLTSGKLKEDATTGRIATRKVGGVQTKADVKVYRSTARHHPMKISALWTWTADVTSQSVIFSGFDTATGAVQTQKVPVTRKGQEVTCSATSPGLNALKSMNDTL